VQLACALDVYCKAVAVPDPAFGRQSNKGAPKSLQLFKYPSFCVTIAGYHTKAVTFYRTRKWLVFGWTMWSFKKTPRF